MTLLAVNAAQVTKAILAMIPKYLEDVADPYDINCGLCEEFAIDVIRELGDGDDAEQFGMVWIEDMVDTPYPDASHAVIYLEAGTCGWLYFDAECPQGVTDVSLIPAIANSGEYGASKSRAEIIAERGRFWE